jgi:hypothetical protein
MIVDSVSIQSFFFAKQTVCEVDEGPCLIFMEQERNFWVFWRGLRFALFVPKDGKM